MAENLASAIVRIRGDTSHISSALNQTRSQLLGLTSPLSRIRDIAAGILLARVFELAVTAIKKFIGIALDATAAMQSLQLRIQSLVAREMADEINATKAVGEAWVTATQIFESATPRAKDLFNQLRRIGVLSPYSIQAAADVMNLVLAFGWGSDEALKMTGAILNLGAGIGATNEVLHRMTFNFAQLKMQGKIMARDFWELGKAGFDLMGVLEELERQTGYNIDTHLDFNKLLAQGKITWQDFADAFSSMVEKDFGGAAARFAVTIQGMKNNLVDVFQLTIPEILMPTAELFGTFAQKALDKLLWLVESGKLEEMGLKLRSTVELWLNVITAVFDKLKEGDGLKGIILTLGEFSLIKWTMGSIGLLSIAEALDKFWSALKNLAGIVWDVIKDGAQGIIDAFVEGKTLEDLGIPGIIDTITETISSLAETIRTNKDAIVEGVTAIATGVKDLAVGLGDLAGASIEVLILTFQILIEFFRQVNPSDVDSMSEGMSNLGGSLSDVATYLRENKVEIALFLSKLAVFGGIVVGVFMAVSLGVKIFAALTVAIEVVSGVVAGLITLFTMGIIPLLALLALGIYIVIANWESFKTMLVLGWIILSTTVQLAIEKVKEWVTETKQKITDGIQILKDKWANFKYDTMNTWMAFKDGIIRIMGEWKQKIEDLWTNTFGKLWDVVTKKLADIINFFKTTFGEFITWVREQVTKFVDVGGSIVEGIKTGVTNAWNSLVTMVTGKIKGLIKTIKESLGIDSPSKAFAEIGLSMGEGLEHGIKDSMNQANKHLASQVQGMMNVGGGASITPRFVNVGSMGIHIYGVSDPEAVANAVEQRLAQKLRFEGVNHMAAV